MGTPEQRYRALISSFPAFQPGYQHFSQWKRSSVRREAPELQGWRRRLEQEESLWPSKPREKLTIEAGDGATTEPPLLSPGSIFPTTREDATDFAPSMSITSSSASSSSVTSVQTRSSSSSPSMVTKETDEEDVTANQQDVLEKKKQRRGARGRRGVKSEKLRENRSW